MSANVDYVPMTDEEKINYYGYREVSRVGADGKSVTSYVPLSLRDLLHPEFGDFAMKGSRHDMIIAYLSMVFRMLLERMPGALVLSDCKVTWRLPDIDHHAPDITVLHGVRVVKDNWGEFVVPDEGVVPDLIVEVVSPNHRDNDVVTKVAHYLKCKVPCYVIVDCDPKTEKISIVGRVRDGNGWRMMEPAVDGLLWLEAVGVFVGIEGNRVRCYDAMTRRPIGDLSETQIEKQRAQQAAIVNAQFRERAEADKERAEEERDLAEAQREKTEAKLERAEVELAKERQVRIDLEKRLAELLSRSEHKNGNQHN
jgi:colicin import membrane protein